MIQKLTEHSKCVSSITITSDSQTLVSGSLDNTIKLWNLKTGELTRTFSGHSDMILSVAVSANGQTIASGGYGDKIKIWQ